jgi:hypothetical protein
MVVKSESGEGAQKAAAAEWETVSAVRLHNLMVLRQEFEEQQRRLSRDGSHKGYDKDFSARLGLHPKYFGHIKAGRRNVGNPLARAAEDAFGKPIGWMDMPHQAVGAPGSEDQSALQTFLDLYRADPPRTRTMLVREMRDRLGGQNRT